MSPNKAYLALLMAAAFWGFGNIAQKTYFVAHYPQDIRGLGLFSVRYNQADSKVPDDSYAYLKSVRRVRRLSGGAWMDPIGGTDQLYDDWDIWDAAPTKYKSNKLIEKRWVLACAMLLPVARQVLHLLRHRRGNTSRRYFFGCCRHRNGRANQCRSAGSNQCWCLSDPQCVRNRGKYFWQGEQVPCRIQALHAALFLAGLQPNAVDPC